MECGEWANEKGKALADRRLNELLKQYDITIEREPKRTGASVGQPYGIRLAFILACLAQCRGPTRRSARAAPRRSASGRRRPEEFAVVWKVPAPPPRPLCGLRTPDACKPKSEPVGSIEGGAFFERWSMQYAPAESKGKRSPLMGPAIPTLTDALARIEYRDAQLRSRG